ncbi:DUF4209 domain-containing protein [Mucilaginibacter sabulilitoris]|uniref:DUF4209 domain-containing protein n=1 Tax=Mucilaginibacter sabulilitoris TaxID=1173583 RepID=A0ABZ0TFC2_9SPHI|nr:DUF4209 domain-containing protein [Mucilaginibacter sabulilitoris]WPU91862.1 DUF4209 domain-containing protein [Mucilaginibacter sabulilitoris]
MAELVSLLLKLLNIDPGSIHEKAQKEDKVFSEQDIALFTNTIIEDVTYNRELLALWYDASFLFSKKQLRDKLVKVSDDYYHVYLETGSHKFLVRRIAVIKLARQFFANRMDTIFLESKEVILSLPHPFWQTPLLAELKFLYGAQKCRDEFEGFLHKQVEVYQGKAEFNAVRICLKALLEIESLTVNEWHIKTAESFEAESDDIVANRKLNTFYPSISRNYLDGLKEIASVQEAKVLKSRLEMKLREAQRDDYKMVRAAGAVILPKTEIRDCHKKIAVFGIDSFESAWRIFVSLPVVPLDTINKTAEGYRKADGPLARFFPAQVKVNEKGAQIGHAGVEDASLNLAREFYRERMIIFIQLLKNQMDIYETLDKQFVFGMVETVQSPFIPEDRTYIFSMGIYEGFNNNFIVAAHLLLPQLENSLRNLAVKAGINTTTYEKKDQHENMLGGILEKIEGLAKPDVLGELKNFLIDTSSVNFRNELLHGLMNTVLVQHYSKYFWWLMLKLVFETKSHFDLE